MTEPKDPSGRFELAFKDSDADEFPVLKAFQGYIEAERQKAQRKVTLLTIAFCAVLLTVILLFGIVFAVFFSQIMSQQERTQTKFYELVDANFRNPREVPQPPLPAPIVPMPAAVQPAVVTQVIVKETAPIQPPPAPVVPVSVKPEPPPDPAPAEPPAQTNKPKPQIIEQPRPVLKPAPTVDAGVVPPPPPKGTVVSELPVPGRVVESLPWRFYQPE